MIARRSSRRDVSSESGILSRMASDLSPVFLAPGIAMYEDKGLGCAVLLGRHLSVSPFQTWRNHSTIVKIDKTASVDRLLISTSF